MYEERLKRLTKRQRVMFLVFCAEQVLPVFEKQYPDDSIPHDAIDAVKMWLENPCGDPVYTTYNCSVDIIEFINKSLEFDKIGAICAAFVAGSAALAVGDMSETAYTNAVDKAFDAGANASVIEKYLKELEKCTPNDYQN